MEVIYLITVGYEKPFTNNVEKDVSDVRNSYLKDLQKLRDYYGSLLVDATFNSRSKLRRVI